MILGEPWKGAIQAAGCSLLVVALMALIHLGVSPIENGQKIKSENSISPSDKAKQIRVPRDFMVYSIPTRAESIEIQPLLALSGNREHPPPPIVDGNTAKPHEVGLCMDGCIDKS